MTLARFDGVLVLLAALAQLSGHALASPSGMTALATTGLVTTGLAATVLAGTLAALLALGARAGWAAPSPPLVSRCSALREKSWCAGFLRQRDPDAAGRARPRAPSGGPAAA